MSGILVPLSSMFPLYFCPRAPATKPLCGKIASGFLAYFAETAEKQIIQFSPPFLRQIDYPAVAVAMTVMYGVRLSRPAIPIARSHSPEHTTDEAQRH